MRRSSHRRCGPAHVAAMMRLNSMTSPTPGDSRNGVEKNGVEKKGAEKNVRLAAKRLSLGWPKQGASACRSGI